MFRNTICFFITVLFLIAPTFLNAEDVTNSDQADNNLLNIEARVHHDLKVVVQPEGQRFTAEDFITLPADYPGEAVFLLHKGLAPSTSTPGVAIFNEPGSDETSVFETFKVKLPEGVRSFVLSYEGIIYHPVESDGQHARGISRTPGMISEKGVYLSKDSFWYPVFPVRLITFSLSLELPPAWDAVSQGRRTLHEKGQKKTHVKWECTEQQDEIFLVASIFREYMQSFVSPFGKTISAMVFLRKEDGNLAQKYLSATIQYITMYENLIGVYPYDKFALVENFWETGFGMPSFTLLGPTVIRLPFIVNSSYPHEILHNWLGNSVFPEYEKGNWSEGLTAYLSDHLMKEQQGNAFEYRLTTLQKYTDYALKERDFSLLEFRSRHSPSSEAIGYGKSLMFFHMLRRDLGDETFKEAIREFYRTNRFRFASFDDLRKSFEKAAGRDLSNMFNQWIQRRGAPELRLKDVSFQPDEDRYILEGKIIQVQDGDPYHLTVPIAVTVGESEQAVMIGLTMTGRELSFSIPVRYHPLRIDLDPESDIFRRLHKNEMPPAVSRVLGAERLLIILPSSAPEEIQQAYIDLSMYLTKSAEGIVSVAMDNELENLPQNKASIVLGWENRFREDFLKMLSPSVRDEHDSIMIDKQNKLKKNHAVVLTAREPEGGGHTLMLIAASLSDALPALGRKLPHYHKYSYLAFEGAGAENVLKGRWPVYNSPLILIFPGKDGKGSTADRGKLWQREPLAPLPLNFSSDRMMSTIQFLSSEEIEGRGFGTQGSDKAAEFIAGKFKEAGLVAAGDEEGSYFQVREERGGDPEKSAMVKNVIGIVPGRKAAFSGQSVVIGAHYDHLGFGWPDARSGNKGKLHPGADDNASGVAVLVELANILNKYYEPDRSIVFAAFAGEEAGRQGSRYYLRKQKNRIIGMLNLDTVGRLENRKLLILGAGSAKEWAYIFRGAGFVTGVEIEAVTEKLDASDNISFEESGIPAVQLFSGPHLDYHRPTDMPDKIDPEGLVKVASVAKEVIEYLAKREDTMTMPEKSKNIENKITKKERKVSLGIVPDFSYKEQGCRLTGVVPESSAEACGLKEGDVIIKIDSQPIRGLKDLSDALKGLDPGKKIFITFIRDGKELTTEAEVTLR